MATPADFLAIRRAKPNSTEARARRVMEYQFPARLRPFFVWTHNTAWVGKRIGTPKADFSPILHELE